MKNSAALKEGIDRGEFGGWIPDQVWNDKWEKRGMDSVSEEGRDGEYRQGRLYNCISIVAGYRLSPVWNTGLLNAPPYPEIATLTLAMTGFMGSGFQIKSGMTKEMLDLNKSPLIPLSRKGENDKWEKRGMDSTNSLNLTRSYLRDYSS